MMLSYYPERKQQTLEYGYFTLLTAVVRKL
jgi:hypothetical protein